MDKEKSTVETSTEEQIKIIAPSTKQEEQEEKKIDLSAIIPAFDEQMDSTQVELSSKEKELKTDGSIVIGTIKGEEVEVSPNVEVPNQIDITFRKNERKKNKDKKKKIETDPEKQAAKQKEKSQNIVSLGALVVILGLVGFYFYYSKVPKAGDFTVLNVEIELGSSLSKRASKYVKPAIGDTVDDMAYAIDTSNVIVDQVGEYPYTVRHNNKVKSGIISIVDRTSPELEVRSVVLTEGEAYSAETFVATCRDLSGCTYSFENQSTESKYTNAGTYVVYIVATDAYGNKSLKQASLIIEAQGMVKYYNKEHTYNFNERYQLVEKYELHFTDFMSNAVILNGVHTEIYTYQSKENYDKAFAEHNGDINYSFDNEKLIMTITEKSNTVGYNYSRLDDVTTYLLTNGFSEQG